MRRIIGHRGAAAQAPENTLAGFRRAAELGIAEIEFDVRVSADGCPVVIHDDRLDRTTDGRGLVAKTPLPGIRGLDAGAWFSAEFAGERVPTLSEALALMAALGVTARLEIKAERGNGGRVAAAVLDTLSRVPENERPAMRVASYRRAVLQAFREAEPRIPRDFVVRRLRPGWRRRVAPLECEEIHGNHHYLTRTAIRAVTAAGYAAVAFTVDDPAHAERLFRWGVARIISDAPDPMLAAMGAA